jgi:hypothetical protein
MPKTTHRRQMPNTAGRSHLREMPVPVSFSFGKSAIRRVPTWHELAGRLPLIHNGAYNFVLHGTRIEQFSGTGEHVLA